MLRRAIDRIQARYGWTDDYVLYQLPLARVMQLFKDITQYRYEEQKDRYKEQAFNAWISYRLRAGENGKDFTEFLNMLNLGEEPQHVTKEEALSKAKSILGMLKGGES
ncbi:hypothetical protein [Bacillus sp. FJAT-52991]|uniref:Phage portal protein n=1 Tax=Bacillus kandeliae TaxID=3129297 RepID=A0ABZ2N2S7_9BACI